MQAYLNDIAKGLEQFKGLLSLMEAGALSSSERDIASVKRHIALNETVLRLERDRTINATRA
jgi:hypothetical protein